MRNKMMLFCFSYAGGNAAFYDQLDIFLKEDIRLVRLEYAGHGTRHKEAFYSDFTELAQDMYRLIKKNYTEGSPYALMGYSMGSISVMETLKQIMLKNELPLPLHIFLAAHEPYTKAELAEFSNSEMDECVKERTIRFGGVPEQLVNNKSFWRMYLPIYRADYGIIGKYDFNSLNLKSNLPATVFYSEEDTLFSDMKKWAEIFINHCDFVRYDGNHFFIREHCQEMADVILERLGLKE